MGDSSPAAWPDSSTAGPSILGTGLWGAGSSSGSGPFSSASPGIIRGPAVTGAIAVPHQPSARPREHSPPTRIASASRRPDRPEVGRGRGRARSSISARFSVEQTRTSLAQPRIGWSRTKQITAVNTFGARSGNQLRSLDRGVGDAGHRSLPVATVLREHATVADLDHAGPVFGVDSRRSRPARPRHGRCSQAPVPANARRASPASRRGSCGERIGGLLFPEVEQRLKAPLGIRELDDPRRAQHTLGSSTSPASGFFRRLPCHASPRGRPLVATLGCTRCSVSETGKTHRSETLSRGAPDTARTWCRQTASWPGTPCLMPERLAKVTRPG